MADDRPGTPAADTPVDTRLVVVVDADRHEVARLSQVVAAAGYPVVTATEGRAALRLIYDSTVTPALLLTAIELPGMSGIELAARMAAARPGLRVVLLSPDPRSVERARDHPSLAHGVLLQPATADALLVAVRSALADGP